MPLAQCPVEVHHDMDYLFSFFLLAFSPGLPLLLLQFSLLCRNVGEVCFFLLLQTKTCDFIDGEILQFMIIVKHVFSLNYNQNPG